MRNVLSIKNLCKRFSNFSLENVSFDVPYGCVVGFIGLNGQGKTTTIKTIIGVSKKDSGDILYFDKNFDSNEKDILDDIGIVFDEGGLYEDIRIIDMKNIVSSGYSNWCEDDYKRYIEVFNLDEKQRISTLSKGMKMKFSLALALSHKAKVLIMDEPTSGLDPLIRRQLLDILKEYMDTYGEGILYSTHITSDLEKFADILVFINNGKIVFVEDKDVLLNSYKIIKGENDKLCTEVEELFLKLNIKKYGFEGISKNTSEILEFIPNAIVERATIEDIMLAYL